MSQARRQGVRQLRGRTARRREEVPTQTGRDGGTSRTTSRTPASGPQQSYAPYRHARSRQHPSTRRTPKPPTTGPACGKLARSTALAEHRRWNTSHRRTGMRARQDDRRTGAAAAAPSASPRACPGRRPERAQTPAPSTELICCGSPQTISKAPARPMASGRAVAATGSGPPLTATTTTGRDAARPTTEASA